MVPESGYLVRIPVLTYFSSPSAVQAEQLGWISALEEIPSSASANGGPGLFPISSPQQGVVALRFNYPYQSSSMSGYQPSTNPTAPPGPNAVPDPTNPTIPISDDGVTLSQQPSDVGAPILSAWQYGRELRHKRSGAADRLGTNGHGLPPRHFLPGHLSPRSLSMNSFTITSLSTNEQYHAIQQNQ